jgi:hypothetical protein
MNPQETLREQIITKAVVHREASAEASLSIIAFYEK